LKISVIVTLRKEVLDPQGKVIQQTLNNMGIKNVNQVRQGKYFEIDIKENNLNEAKNLADDICKKLLSNSIIENYKIIS
tara:strand:+ start:161 stop:397 length:237 start_codon:yes stop_codon:yes gene_type:complete